MAREKKSGAWLVRHALEQMPVSHTFGIPGVHNTEIYDELGKSEKIRPVLVTHELSAGFMADATSRTSEKIGVLVIVPAAGATHAMSGIAEAYLDGIPMIIISGGIRTDLKFGYQLHEIDQAKLLQGVTKKFIRIREHSEIVPELFEAYRVATGGTPGPVFVEVPVNIQLFQGDIGELPKFKPHRPEPASPSLPDQISRAVDILKSASNPGIFVGWGAIDVSAETREIAERLGAPVATTLQGMSAFPGDHPLRAGMGFSRASVPASENAFARCDALLAVGVRFAEIPTGSFGAKIPENLIHIDIDPAVLNRNFPAKIPIAGDSRIVLPALVEELRKRGLNQVARKESVSAAIARDRARYLGEWQKHALKVPDRVSPALFFGALRRKLSDDAVVCVDDGNHTFLAAELFDVRAPRTFVSPTDFNCMGYCVPATIGAKLAHPGRQVVGIVGDGAFLMTGLETLTASVENLGIVLFVFYDGELAQISQGQEIPYNRKICTLLGPIRLEGVALATGAKHLEIEKNADIDAGIEDALTAAARGQPVIVEVKVDYSRRTRFTEGVVKTVLERFPLGDKFRFIGRALVRKITG